MTADGLLDTPLHVPQHVVHRGFADETIVLNLETGIYHGLNPVAGRVLEVLEETASGRAAVQRLVEEWDVDEGRARTDVLQLCEDLLERGILTRGA